MARLKSLLVIWTLATVNILWILASKHGLSSQHIATLAFSLIPNITSTFQTSNNHAPTLPNYETSSPPVPLPLPPDKTTTHKEGEPSIEGPVSSLSPTPQPHKSIHESLAESTEQNNGSATPLGKLRGPGDLPAADPDLEFVERCSLRDEWRPPCNSSEGRLLRRFLIVGPYASRAGTGHAMAMVGHLVRLSIKYKLQLVFAPPLSDRGGTDLGEFFGMAESPAFVREDDPEVRAAELVYLPNTSLEERLAVLDSQVNRTYVKYDALVERCQVRFADGHWAVKGPDAIGSPECVEPRFALREWFRTARPRHKSCDPFLPIAKMPFSGKWVVAVHIRRGDIAIDAEERWKLRNVPHSWYVLAVEMVLRAILKLESGVDVIVVVFCEGVNGQIVDEMGAPVVWEIGKSRECTEMGLKCLQVNVIEGSVQEALDCLIASDVFIGSKSGFSHIAGVLSSNVKVVPSMWHKYARQDSVVVGFRNRTDAGTHDMKQDEVDAVVSRWKSCGSYAIRKKNPYVCGYRISTPA